MTNDAWYGVSAGPHQHLANAKLRAVEEGLPVLRAAYTGISAAFDPFGRVLGSIPLNEEGFLDLKLPNELVSRTFYSMWGDKIFFILMIFVFCIALIMNRYRI